MQSHSDTLKRPGLVWAISVLYFMSGAYTLLSFYLVYSGVIQLPPAQREYLDRLTLLDHAVSIAVGTASLAGAVALLMLRRIAFHLFAAAFAANVAVVAWQVLARGFAAAVGAGGIGSMLFAWALLTAVCVYTWRLSRSGVLR